MGRRKPYFLVGAILASLALFIMPNSPVLWFAAGMLWILDASINVSMEPFRAFVGDNLPDSQRTTGFAMQSFFIGIGAYFASKLPLIFTHFARWGLEVHAGTEETASKSEILFCAKDPRCYTYPINYDGVNLSPIIMDKRFSYSGSGSL